MSHVPTDRYLLAKIQQQHLRMLDSAQTREARKRLSQYLDAGARELTPEQAQAMLDNFHSQFPTLRQFHEQIAAHVAEHGYPVRPAIYGQTREAAQLKLDYRKLPWHRRFLANLRRLVLQVRRALSRWGLL